MRGKFEEFRLYAAQEVGPGDLVAPVGGDSFSRALVGASQDGNAQVPLNGQYAFHFTPWRIPAWLRLAPAADLLLEIHPDSVPDAPEAQPRTPGNITLTSSGPLLCVKVRGSYGFDDPRMLSLKNFELVDWRWGDEAIIVRSAWKLGRLSAQGQFEVLFEKS